jgi:soluble lytic murein transglycosylase-like protein
VRISLLLTLVSFGLFPAMASEVVTFEDGRTLHVSRAEAQEGFLLLDLEGGGQMAVPAKSVTSIEPFIEAAVADLADVEAVVAEANALREGDAWRVAAGSFADWIAESADRHGLDRALLAAVARWESNFDPYAVSHRGACGMLQLMPKTAERFGVARIFDARENIEGGAKYLRWLLDRFRGRVDLALAGYNAGERAVDRHGGIPPYRETRAYVARVLGGIEPKASGGR